MGDRFNFADVVTDALADDQLQGALAKLQVGFIEKRRQAVERMPEFDALRDAAKAIKDDVLDHLDVYLERFEAKVQETGGVVHWCSDASAARETVLRLCTDIGARTVIKSKSMIAEEININSYLEDHHIQPIETDLGEYIIQLAGERPSHIIAPAIHKSREQVAKLFETAHAPLNKDNCRKNTAELVREARDILREKFLSADVGITGANFLVAETGSVVIVTNEGNADLLQTLPSMHIVLASLEKVVPTVEDTATLLRVLTRSATGQEATAYMTFATGPRRLNDLDGPDRFHVVLIDNGRSKLLGGEFRDILRCIRCGACLGHCPVYAAIGGHAYGSVYSGPMGAVLTPGLAGIKARSDLPNASTFCGRCESVCPVRIPLPKLLRHWRERALADSLVPIRHEVGMAIWIWLAVRPRLYFLMVSLTASVLAFVGRRKGHFRNVPLAGRWTRGRDIPVPEGGSFYLHWKRKQKVQG